MGTFGHCGHVGCGHGETSASNEPCLYDDVSTFSARKSITLRFELLLEAQIMSWSTIKLPLTKKSHSYTGSMLTYGMVLEGNK